MNNIQRLALMWLKGDIQGTELAKKLKVSRTHGFVTAAYAMREMLKKGIIKTNSDI